MSLKITKFDKLKKIIHDNTIVAVKFYSPSCPACKFIQREYETLAKSNNNKRTKFVSVNTETSSDLSDTFKIRAVPTFFVYIQGQLVDIVEGADIKKLVQVLLHSIP